MEIKTNDNAMEIHAQYESRKEFRQKALQRKIKHSIKILERGGMIKTDINIEKLTVYIKCYDLKIYNQILKGFQSVAETT